MAEAAKLVESRITAAQQAAENGDESQRKLIEQLADPELGKQMIDFMLFPLIEKYGSKLYSTSQTPSSEDGVGVRGKSTDERSKNPSRTGMPPLPPLDKTRGGVNTDFAMSVLREIQRRRGRSA